MTILLLVLPLVPLHAKRKTPKAETLTPPGRKLLHHSFKTPPELRPQVDFWKSIYSKYDDNYVLLHDTEHLDIVYAVINVSKILGDPYLTPQQKKEMKGLQVDTEMERIRTILLKLHDVDMGTTALADLNADEKKIYDFFKNVTEPERFKTAATPARLRSQTAMKNKFMSAIAASGTYLPQMEEIFNSYSIPSEITRLVFVESMFNFKAISKVGASGLWQFMPGTGKLYLNINDVVDERNDPLSATHAAAKLLKSNYEALGTWPLAINAYNSGRGSLRRAIDTLGTTDIATIITQYRGGSYGFASRNFFPSFLAALETAENYSKYFGSIKKEPPALLEKFPLSQEASLDDLANETGLSKDVLVRLNLGLKDPYLHEGKPIPTGATINIPRGEAPLFAKALKKIVEYRLVSADPSKNPLVIQK
ncbi:MAG: transglycosylase SLT domain-containing protein [Deltaproteobacteria bacterium]|nr:transglycosylase SLT domain-containing protein [Deltaproteobacteria bacterium]